MSARSDLTSSVSKPCASLTLKPGTRPSLAYSYRYTHNTMAATTQSSICCLSRATFRASAPRLTAPISRANHSTSVYSSAQRPTAVTLSHLSQQTLSSPAIPFARHASTTSTSPSATTTTSQLEQPALTWDEFLKLRRTRRYINLGASVVSGLGSIAIAAPIMAEYEIENIGAQMTGMDPVFVLGGSLVTVGAVGWLMGPFLGTAVFKLWKSSATVEFARVRTCCASFAAGHFPRAVAVCVMWKESADVI